MPLWRQLTRGLRALIHRSAADQDVADEVQHYLEEATAAHLARGLSPDQAFRAARLELGGVTSVREQVRGYGWENAIERLLADLRYAARRLRVAPGFTATAILTLAIGIGGTTAIFSALNPILFESLPYPDPGRLVAVQEVNRDGSINQGTFGMYRALADRLRSFDAIAVLKPWSPIMTGTGQPEALDAQRVSAGYFHVLGRSPAMGRDFEASDDRLGGPNVVILNDGLWRRRFGGDSGIVGHPITLQEARGFATDDQYVVIGVMPSGFENVLAPAAALWAPLQYDMAQGRAWGHHLRTVGRLKPGIALDRAAGEVDQSGRAVLTELHPETYGPGVTLRTTSLQDDITRGVRPALLAILGAMTLVLLIACVNVANLLLARGVQRRGEFALRAALGAGSRRLVRQLLTESLLLAMLGGALGMAAAMLGVRALVALSPPGLPRAGAIHVNAAVFVFGLSVTALVGLAFGLIPAFQAAKSGPHQGLQAGSTRTAGTHRKTRGALVVAEVALALVLLVSSGLLLRSLNRLFAVEAGFDPSQLLTMKVQTAGRRFWSDSTTFRFFAQALEEARRVPGVTAAAMTSQLPLSGDRDEYGARPDAQSPQGFSVFRYAVSPRYLETMGIPLKRGRALEERDGAGAPPVIVISESLVRHLFERQDPIGQRVFVGPAIGEPYTVVGVVGDVKQQSLAADEAAAVYIPATQWHSADDAMSLVVRTRGDPAAVAPAIRQAVRSADKDQPIVRVAMMDDLLAASAAERRFALILFEAFALAALVLAAAGIYGVLSGSVAERTREIGVRSALGASREKILALVLRQGLGLTALGVALGLAGALGATRALVAMLFGVSRFDPVTYLGVVALLASVSLIACALPAWRAACVDPASTLRTG